MSKIYKIENDINDKVYIGKTEFSLEKRFKEHCQDSQKITKEKRPLYNAMRKYGIEHFFISELEDCSREKSAEREKYWIDFYESYSKGYNATLGGDGKTYINAEEILKLWEDGSLIKEIAEKVKHDKTMISKILINYGISKEDIKNRQFKNIKKRVNILDKNTNEILHTFESTREAARFLIEKKSLRASSIGGYSSHIGEVCKGKRKTCEGYKWSYTDI